jgi:hypothetical protein
MTKQQKRIYNAEYRSKHQEEFAKRDAEYYIAHREEVAKRNAKYDETHSEERAEYRAAHREEQAAYRAAHSKEHSKYRELHRVEAAWHNMHQRAGNKSGQYPTYLHVHVCRRWSGPKGQANFLMDMGPRPVGTTLSRLGDIGNYCKRRCRWHTWKQQREEARKKRLKIQQEIK